MKSFIEFVAEQDTSSVAPVETPIDSIVKRKPVGMFGDMAVFDLTEEEFNSMQWGKGDKKHWRKFAGSDDLTMGIQEYVKKNPGKKFLLRNSANGATVHGRSRHHPISR